LEVLMGTALTLFQSSNTLAHDPVFLGVFFVLGYRKLFSDSSNTTIGSIMLLGSLSVAAAWFVRACTSAPFIELRTKYAPPSFAPQTTPPSAPDIPTTATTSRSQRTEGVDETTILSMILQMLTHHQES